MTHPAQRNDARTLIPVNSTPFRRCFDSGWTRTHGFFVLMGGYHRYDGTTPVHPLHFEDVVTLVKDGYILLPGDPIAPPNSSGGPSEPIAPTLSPTLDEIKGRSKGDSFSKAFTLLQTTWFVIQCIARSIQPHLPITQLEIVTLAYTTHQHTDVLLLVLVGQTAECGVAYPYPSEISSSTSQIPDHARPRMDRMRSYLIFVTFFGVHSGLSIFGNTVSDDSGLIKRNQVPTFYSGLEPDNDLFSKASSISSITYIVFSAIHCIAWTFSFPTPTEQELWHISSIV